MSPTANWLLTAYEKKEKPVSASSSDIEAGHGQQIRNAGFSSAEEFVETVARNYDTIREGSIVANNQTYLLEMSDEHNNTLFIQLSMDGKYWNVNSAGIFKKKYSRNKAEVYTRPAVEPGTDTDSSGVNRGQTEGATATSGKNSPETSTRKDTNISETEQKNVASAIKSAESDVNTDPTEGQKKAGNYKKGHLKLDGYDITIEQPKGSVRRGTDDNGKQWEQEMHNTYGYIRGTEGVDGDHIDVFLSDEPTQGKVFVVDQVNLETGEFDEHKVMYGFQDMESAKQAYLSNYEDGWQGLGNIAEVGKEEFRKWTESSRRKTKPFGEYKSVKRIADSEETDDGARLRKKNDERAETGRAARVEAVVEQLKKMGLRGEVVTVKTTAEAKKFIDERKAEKEAKAEKLFTDRLNAVEKVSQFIGSVLSGTNTGKSIKIDLPETANKLAEKALGHKINSHRIKASAIIHSKKRHGIKGTANNESSIPLRDSDFALMPYIMVAPTRVVKGTTATNGTESVRYEKELSNGVVVVVEREGRFDVADMENITMWATKKSATKVTDAKQASHDTSETIVLSEADVAKIIKNSETAIKNEIKNENIFYQWVYHGSPYNFRKFDFQHIGSGEGAQAYGWGGYVTEVEGIGRSYADRMGQNSIKTLFIKGLPVYENGRPIDYRYRKQNDDVAILQEQLLINGYMFIQDLSPNDLLKQVQNFFDEEIRSAKQEAEDDDSYNGYIETLKKYRPEKVSDIKLEKEKGRHLYNVEIPDDDGTNYLHWENTFEEQPDGVKAKIVEMQEDEALYGNLTNVNVKNQTGEEFYKKLSILLGSDKAASEFLKSAGFTGISYPAEYNSGGREDGKRNYVIFNENDMEITDHTQWEYGPEGEIAGATLPDGTVVLVSDNMTVDTPFHEFAQKLRRYAKAHPELAKMSAAIDKYAEEAPQSIKDYVEETYGLKPGTDGFVNEVYAWALSMQGKDKIEEFLQSRGRAGR